MDDDAHWLGMAVDEARTGWDEGGVPIGAALVHDGRLLATGRNRRVQLGSAIRHGETDCIERAGRQPAAVYRASVLYTTLSPCFMCAGTVLLYGIPRVVVGENRIDARSTGTPVRCASAIRTCARRRARRRAPRVTE